MRGDCTIQEKKLCYLEGVFMNRDDLKYFLSQNLLTTAQATDVLCMSKQLLAHYVKNGIIEPIVETTQGYLYLKSDLDRFNQQRTKILFSDEKDIQRVLFCTRGVTHVCEDFFFENRDFLGEIACVSIFFEQFDAIINGNFRKAAENEIMPRMCSLEAPHMVVRDTEGKEIWLSGCNCGYGGAGPNGSIRILKKIGVPSELLENVYYHNILHYYWDEDCGWQVRYEKSHIRECESSVSKYKANNFYADIVLRDDNLVLLEKAHHYCFYDADPKPFLEKYSQFIPSPIRILLLTDEQAKRLGYIDYRKFGNAQIYNLIIIDSSGRELWLSIDVDDKLPFNKQYTLLDLLTRCGFELATTDALSDKIKKWLGLMPINAGVCELKPKTSV